MHSKMSWMAAAAAVAALALGCGGEETESAPKAEVIEDFSDLALEKDDAFSNKWRILGTLAYGQTSAAVRYSNPPRFRAFRFTGRPGDQVDVRVRSPDGDAIAWVLDRSYRVLGSNDDADGTTDAHVALTLPGDPGRGASTYYIVLREYRQRRATFTVELRGRSAGCAYEGQTYAVGESFPSSDGCNTCFCGENGQVGCTKRACLATCTYAGRTYPVGESFPASDGCNECTCGPDGQVGCTKIFCPGPSCEGVTCRPGTHCSICRTASGPGPVCLPDGAVC